MPLTVSIKKARANLSEILTRIHSGKRAMVVTKFGQPFAVMMPINQKFFKKISLKPAKTGHWTKLARQAVATSETALRTGKYHIFDNTPDLIASLHKAVRTSSLK